MSSSTYFDIQLLEQLLIKYGIGFDYTTFSPAILHWHFDGKGTLIIIYLDGSVLKSYIVKRMLNTQIEDPGTGKTLDITDFQYVDPLLDIPKFLNDNFAYLPTGFHDELTQTNEKKNMYYLVHKHNEISTETIRINTLPGPPGPIGPPGAPGVDGMDWQADVVDLSATSYTTLCPPSSNNHIFILANTVAAPVTITLECGCYSVGQVVEIKDKNNNAFINNITITAGVGNTIDGGMTYDITKNGDSVKLILTSIAPCTWQLFGDDACCAASEVQTYFTPVNYPVPFTDSVYDHFQEIDNRFGDLATAESDIVDLESDITSLNGQISAINTTITGINSDIGTLQTQVSSFSSSISAINTAVSSVQTQVGVNTADITGLRTDVDSLILSQGVQDARITANENDIISINTILNTFPYSPTVNYNETAPTLVGHIEGIDIRLGDLTDLENRINDLSTSSVSPVNPVYYTPNAGVALENHLQGIDNRFADIRNITFIGSLPPSSVGYTPTGSQLLLLEHLQGINNELVTHDGIMDTNLGLIQDNEVEIDNINDRINDITDSITNGSTPLADPIAYTLTGYNSELTGDTLEHHLIAIDTVLTNISPSYDPDHYADPVDFTNIDQHLENIDDQFDLVTPTFNGQSGYVTPANVNDIDQHLVNIDNKLVDLTPNHTAVNYPLPTNIDDINEHLDNIDDQFDKVTPDYSTPVNYTAPVPIDEIDGHLENIDIKLGELTPSVAPANYTHTVGDIDTYLSGINVALGDLQAEPTATPSYAHTPGDVNTYFVGIDAALTALEPTATPSYTHTVGDIDTYLNGIDVELTALVPTFNTQNAYDIPTNVSDIDEHLENIDDKFVANRNTYVTRSAATPALTNDGYENFVSVTAGSITLTLPALSGLDSGTIYKFYDETGVAGTNNITISGNGADTIDGVGSYVMNQNNILVAFMYDGSEWKRTDTYIRL